MNVHKAEVRVSYSDTDQMKFVYNGNYLKYFEVGRTEMLRENGLPYKNIEELGYYLPVREAFVKYKSPAFYDEILVVESVVKDIPASKIHIDHIIRSKDRGVIVVEGYIELAFINAKTNRPTRAPQFLVDVIKKYYEL